MGCSKLKVVIAIVCVCSCNLWSLHNDSQSMACSQVFHSRWIAVKFWGSCSLPNHWIPCQICSQNSRLVMISYNIKFHNIITKLQICIIFLQPLILWPVGSNSRRRRRRQQGLIYQGSCLGLQPQRHGQRQYVKQWSKPEMRGFVWLEKEVKLEEAAAAGGQVFCIIIGQQGVSSTIRSLTRHHPLPIHECLGCLRCTQDFKDCGPETFRLGLPKQHWWVMMTPSCSSHTIWCKSCSSTITPNLSMWVMQVMQA